MLPHVIITVVMTPTYLECHATNAVEAEVLGGALHLGIKMISFKLVAAALKAAPLASVTC
jgi:metal-sulfur cluster biosynthetic enzyme